MICLMQFGMNEHSKNFLKPTNRQVDFLVFKKLTCAHLFQNALNII